MLLARLVRASVCRLLLPAVAALAAASPSAAAAQVRSESASVRIVVTVPAVLWIEAATPVAHDTVAGYEVVTTRVTVRGNVPHRLEVRAPATSASAVRLRGGQWISLDDRGVTAARTDMIGDTSHLVTCRTPTRPRADRRVRGCALAFAIVSTDMQFPAESGEFVAMR